MEFDIMVSSKPKMDRLEIKSCWYKGKGQEQSWVTCSINILPSMEARQADCSSSPLWQSALRCGDVTWHGSHWFVCMIVGGTSVYLQYIIPPSLQLLLFTMGSLHCWITTHYTTLKQHFIAELHHYLTSFSKLLLAFFIIDSPRANTYYHLPA